MKPQQKKLTTVEKIELTILVEKEITGLRKTLITINEVDSDHNEKLNELLGKEIEVLETILQKLQ